MNMVKLLMMIRFLRFAMRDIAFNLVPENIFVAPFQRFQTSQVAALAKAKEPGMKGKVMAGMDLLEPGDQEAKFEGRPVEVASIVGLDDPIDRGGGEGDFEGKSVDGANVLGLVTAAAALGTAAALRKEEGRLVVEVRCFILQLVLILQLNFTLELNFILQLGLIALACRSVPAWPLLSPCCSKQPFATSVRLDSFPLWQRRCCQWHTTKCQNLNSLNTRHSCLF